MSNPRTPRQEENWILAGRQWPNWTEPGAPDAPPIHEPKEPNGRNAPSWCGLESIHRTEEQIRADDAELAKRKALNAGKVAA